MPKFFQCLACKKQFDTQRSLSLHLSKIYYCKTILNKLHYQYSKDPYLNLKQHVQNRIQNNDNQCDNCLESHNENLLNFEADNDSIESSNSGTTITSNPFHYTDKIVNEVNLLKIINDIGAPLYAYESIMKWARESYMSKYTFDSKYKTYK